MDATALYTLSLGVYIAGTQNGGRAIDAVAQIADGVLAKDSDPWLVAAFGFQTSAKADKWGAIPHSDWLGFPVPEDCLARILLEVEETREYPSHLLTLCRVTDAEKVRAGEPMTYGYYQSDVKTAAQAAYKARLG